jgi:hypothetical protein
MDLRATLRLLSLHWVMALSSRPGENGEHVRHSIDHFFTEWKQRESHVLQYVEDELAPAQDVVVDPPQRRLENLKLRVDFQVFGRQKHDYRVLLQVVHFVLLAHLREVVLYVLDGCGFQFRPVVVVGEPKFKNDSYLRALQATPAKNKYS